MGIMTQSQTLGDWIKSAFGDQGGLAEVLDPPVAKNTVSSWKTGRNGVPPEYQKQIRKLGFKGPWPREEAQEAAAAGPAPYVTREETAELKGRLEGRIEVLERALEKLGEAVRLLLQEREESRQAGRR
jgi:hypothetical protein